MKTAQHFFVFYTCWQISCARHLYFSYCYRMVKRNLLSCVTTKAFFLVNLGNRYKGLRKPQRLIETAENQKLKGAKRQKSAEGNLAQTTSSTHIMIMHLHMTTSRNVITSHPSKPPNPPNPPNPLHPYNALAHHHMTYYYHIPLTAKIIITETNSAGDTSKIFAAPKSATLPCNLRARKRKWQPF